VIQLANSKATVCWTVGSISNVCEPTLFDSGNPSGMQLYGGQLGQAPTAPGSTRVVTGTQVSAALPGASNPFWSFAAGTVPSQNRVQVHSSGTGTVNTGVQAFFAFKLTFNAVRKTISLSPQA
jgi:hypothetical protein